MEGALLDEVAKYGVPIMNLIQLYFILRLYIRQIRIMDSLKHNFDIDIQE